MDRPAYLSSLPRKRIAAAALIRDESDRVCLRVKGNYRPDWHMPGGTIESDESPADGCQRELLEELGLVIELGRLLCVEMGQGPRGRRARRNPAGARQRGDQSHRAAVR